MAQKFITYYGEYSLKHWIRMILNKEIVLPPYQRYFVWKPEKVLKLIENINENLFVPPVILSSFSGDAQDKEANYILDGQQRLSAILLAYLGYFPLGFDGFSSELANEENYMSGNNEDEEEDAINSLEWSLKLIQDMYADDSICNIEQLRNAIAKDEKYIKIDKNMAHAFKNPQIISEEILEKFSNITIDDNFLDTHFLGFSYIKPVTPDAVAEKNMFSSIFRNINISSVPLLPEESRAALYWLKPDVVNFLDPETFKNIKVNNKKMDFARSLAYVSEAHKIYQKDKWTMLYKVAVGYGRSRRFEDYIEKYVYSVTENKNSDTFGNFQSLFSDCGGAIDKLYQEFTKLSLPKTYSGLVELDFYFFGLMFWVLFEKYHIKSDKQEELKKDLIERISDHKSVFPNVSQLGGLRQRLTKSIKIYEKYVEK